MYFRPPPRARDFGRLNHKEHRLASSLGEKRTAEMKEERKKRRKEVGCEAQLPQNTVTHDSLIETPQYYGNTYHLQEDYYSSHPPCQSIY